MQNPQIFSFSEQELRLIAKIIKEAPIDKSTINLVRQALKTQFDMELPDESIRDLIKKIENDRIEDQSEQRPPKKNLPTLPLFASFGNQSDNNRSRPEIRPQKDKNQRNILYSYRSNRKIVPKPDNPKNNCGLQQRLKYIQEINEECNLTFEKFDRKLNKKLSMPEPNTINQRELWFFNEYFYSNYDRRFFSQNHYSDILAHLDYSLPIQFRQAKKILEFLPKPTLFDTQFITKEREALQTYRKACRQESKLLSKHNEATDYAVHSVVLALHPMCGHLHLGSILAFYKQNQYMVKFLKPELPTHKILDINMSTEYTNSTTRQNKYQVEREVNSKMQIQSQISQITDNINYRATAFLINLLALKSDLMKQLRKSNDWMKDILQDNRLEETKEQISRQKKKVLWISHFLAYLDILIKKAVIKFRLRCPQDQKLSQKNINLLLINPLKLMSKEFDNSSEELDIKATAQIKQILKRQRQNQVLHVLGNLNSEKLTKLSDQQINLIRSCLLVLTDLKSEGKQFDVRNNQNLCKLVEIVSEENLGEEFNEVYQKIYSIVSKIKDL